MKKLIVILLVLLPLGGFSQEVKIAIVNAAEVFNLMPELADVETKLAALNAQYQSDIKAMADEYNMKYEEYMKLQETLTENLKLRRQQELQDIQDRYQNFLPVAQQDMENKQAELFAPIQDRLQKAIQAVCDEQGYTVILNPQALLATGNAIDATPLVKTKLGLK